MNGEKIELNDEALIEFKEFTTKLNELTNKLLLTKSEVTQKINDEFRAQMYS